VKTIYCTEFNFQADGIRDKTENITPKRVGSELL